jgi:trans-aconitate 2-methyltransferase
VADWDAAAYERVSDPQVRWGRRVIERLPLRGDETVLDAGCGTGRVTRLIAERVPRGRVIAVDASEAMVEEAGRRLADLAGRVEVRRADLLELDLGEPVGAIISTATFHWIADHERLFARLAATLSPGGRLVAQCGGRGNVAGALAAAAAAGAESPFAAHLGEVPRAWYFAGPEETEARLRAAGFAEARAWLEPSPADFALPDGADYLATVVLRCHVALLPEGLRAPFARRVAERLTRADGRVEVDYVRLNMDARAPGGAPSR